MYVSLIIDYNAAFLAIAAVGMGSDSTLRVGGNLFSEMGESQGGWEIVEQQLGEELHLRLRAYEGAGGGDVEDEKKMRREDVKTVVLAGDASSAAFALLKMTFRDLLPHLNGESCEAGERYG